MTNEYFSMSDFEGRFSQFDADAEEKFGDPHPPFYGTFHKARAADAIASSQSNSPAAGLLERLQASAAKAASAVDLEAGQIQAMFKHLG